MQRNRLLAICAVICFSVFVFPKTAVGAIRALQNAVLAQLAPSLAPRGITVRLGALESSEKISALTVNLGELSQFPVSPDALKKAIEIQHQLGVGAAHEASLIAVNRSMATQTSKSASTFKRMWANASASERVFVSFTRADAKYASIVRASLEAQGYRVFTYVKGTARPAFNLVEVGTFFREAGHHFVVDTRNARSSPGVNLEAAMLQGQTERPPLIVADRGWPVPPNPREFCCKLCRTINGVATNQCGPPTCGIHCKNARE